MALASLKTTAPTTTPYDDLNAVLENARVSKTVYSYVMPETEQVLDELLDRDREALHALYREAWTQKQDAMHEAFISTWKEWSAPVVKFDDTAFPRAYPTFGASEALREAIYAYGAKARIAGFTPVIHVFDGEYEGFAAYADAAGIAVRSHNRREWRDAIGEVGDTDQFYLSHPSAIDGNVWAEYDAFAQALLAAAPGAALMLDLTYVGCVAKPFTVKADYANIETIFFSLSKPMGLYYHRVGGCLSRRAYPGLFGNKWFKNLLSLELGTAMMRRFGVFDIPRRYVAQAQLPAVETARAELGFDLAPSDVWLLATAGKSGAPGDLERYLLRGSTGEERARVCLTPLIATIIDPVACGTVRARPHETLPD